MNPAGARVGCGCLWALAGLLSTLTIGIALVVLLVDGPRQWVADTFLGCESEIVERTETDSEGTSYTWFCDKGSGELEEITLPLIAIAFVPLALEAVAGMFLGLLWKVGKGALLFSRFFGRGRGGGPGYPGGFGQPGFGGPGGWRG